MALVFQDSREASHYVELDESSSPWLLVTSSTLKRPRNLSYVRRSECEGTFLHHIEAHVACMIDESKLTQMRVRPSTV